MDDRDRLIQQAVEVIESNDHLLSTIKPSDWAEKYRMMSTEVSPFPGKFSYDRTPYLREPVDCLSPEHPARVVAVMKGAQIGFALDVETDIPTPSGMVKMKDLKVGDKVYDEGGSVCNVIKATDIMYNHKCYDVHFTDGTVIKCDADHLWTVKDLKNISRTLNTEYISKRFKQVRSSGKSRNRYYIKNCKPVNYTNKILPIEPYLLGVWLGDGTTNGNRITCEKNDLEYYKSEFNKRGINVKSTPYKDQENCYNIHIIDAFNSWKGGYNIYGNKHIPEIYLRSSIKQRLSLLQGLIDTDGHIMKDGKVEFYNTDYDLILQVKELISSLGYKVTIRKRDNTDKYTTIIPGKRYKMKDIYVLNFMGYKEMPVALLPRKANRLRSNKDIRVEVNKKWICKVEECLSVPVKCITVDSKSHLYLASKSYIPTHNSTGVIESGIGWIMSQNPGNILFLTGDKELSKEAMEAKVDQMIDSCGLRPLIGPNVVRKRNQRTGDTSSSKEFPGGKLIAGSAQNANKLRQRSMRYGFIDDFEAAPNSDNSAGSITSLIETRFEAYYNIMKLFYISTPELKQGSNIEPVFLQGDQRLFHVPCPLCHEKIPLLWRVELEGAKESAGIHYELNSHGKVIDDSVGYVCQKCGGFFTDKHKYKMNLEGEWRPTAVPTEQGYYSYLINSLYSPPGMTPWLGYVRRWVKANPKGQPPKVAQLKTFFNTVLGKTWEEKGEAPKVIELSKQTRSYPIGTIPEQLSMNDGNGRIVLVTCACDLNGTIDDARLDYEIVAWSESGSSYSVDHGSIGSFKNRRAKDDMEKRDIRTYRNEMSHNVWQEFDVVIKKIYVTDTGRQMKVFISGIDTGHYTHFAYTYIDNVKNSYVIGLKGKDDLKYRKVGIDTSYFKLSKERSNLYLLEVNQIKDEVAEMIKLRWDRTDSFPQPAGFMNFPQPADGKYLLRSFFTHFEGEHKVDDENKQGEVVGTRWVKKTTNALNHFWDCRVYNHALKEILMTLVCKEAGVKYPSWQAYIHLITGK